MLNERQIIKYDLIANLKIGLALKDHYFLSRVKHMETQNMNIELRY